MKRLLPFVLLTLAMPLLASCSTTAVPVLHAHAHNDYQHPHPLFDALDNGFLSIEADVVLVGDDLYVAHDAKHVTRSRTVEALYLDALAQRIQEHRGWVYGPFDNSVILLVDFKSDAAPTYSCLNKILSRYDKLLTHFHGDQVTKGPLTIVLTGNEPREVILHETDRIVAVDGVLDDLKTNPPNSIVIMVSAKWSDNFIWNGKGPMPDFERVKLKQFADRAHAQHRSIRFWGAPDNPNAWEELRRAGVDWINTDHLAECRRFLQSKSSLTGHFAAPTPAAHRASNAATAPARSDLR